MGGWRGVIDAALADPGGLILGVGVLFVMLLAETAAFGIRFATRTEEQEAIDEYRGASMLMKIACLSIIGLMILPFSTSLSLRALVIAIAILSIWIEGVPRHAARTFGYRPQLPGEHGG